MHCLTHKGGSTLGLPIVKLNTFSLPILKASFTAYSFISRIIEPLLPQSINFLLIINFSFPPSIALEIKSLAYSYQNPCP